MESPKFVSADKCSCADSLDATLALLILLWFCAEDIQMPDSQGTKSYDSRDRGSNPSRRGRPGGRVYYVPDALSWELNPCHKLYLPPIDFTPEPERAWRACLTFPIKQCGQEGAEAE